MAKKTATKSTTTSDKQFKFCYEAVLNSDEPCEIVDVEGNKVERTTAQLVEELIVAREEIPRSTESLLTARVAIVRALMPFRKALGDQHYSQAKEALGVKELCSGEGETSDWVSPTMRVVKNLDEHPEPKVVKLLLQVFAEFVSKGKTSMTSLLKTYKIRALKKDQKTGQNFYKEAGLFGTRPDSKCKALTEPAEVAGGKNTVKGVRLHKASLNEIHAAILARYDSGDEAFTDETIVNFVCNLVQAVGINVNEARQKMESIVARAHEKAVNKKAA
jgi:hypothetical protein